MDDKELELLPVLDAGTDESKRKALELMLYYCGKEDNE